MTVEQFSYLRDPLDHRNFLSHPVQAQLWHDICRAALDDKELQTALEHVKVMYYLKYNHARTADVRY
jgi:heme oxygenase